MSEYAEYQVFGRRKNGTTVTWMPCGVKTTDPNVARKWLKDWRKTGGQLGMEYKVMMRTVSPWCNILEKEEDQA